MVEKEQLTKEKVEHSGFFDFAALYSFSHSWWKEAQYGVTEEKYSEKVNGEKRDILIEWKIFKDVSDYFKYEHKVKFEISEMTDIEAEIDGEKKKMNKGKISIEITGVIVFDKNSKWESSPFNRFMRDVYNKYVIPSRVDSLKDKAVGDVVNFKEEVKSFLELSARR